MNAGARQRAVLAVTLSALATACGAKHVDLAVPSVSGQTMVVLLPDANGTVGRAVVSNREGSVNLAAARDKTQVTANRPPAAVETLSAQDVKRLFGEALSALPPAPKHFTLYFKFESDELTDASRALVTEIQQAVKERPTPDIVVVGHTDTMGSARANFDLGLKRAMTVRNLLRQAGIGSATVDVTSLGEADLLIKTADGTPEPRNRRVEIAVR